MDITEDDPNYDPNNASDMAILEADAKMDEENEGQVLNFDVLPESPPHPSLAYAFVFMIFVCILFLLGFVSYHTEMSSAVKPPPSPANGNEDSDDDDDDYQLPFDTNLSPVRARRSSQFVDNDRKVESGSISIKSQSGDANNNDNDNNNDNNNVNEREASARRVLTGFQLTDLTCPGVDMKTRAQHIAERGDKVPAASGKGHWQLSFVFFLWIFQRLLSFSFHCCLFGF